MALPLRSGSGVAKDMDWGVTSKDMGAKKKTRPRQKRAGLRASVFSCIYQAPASWSKSALWKV